MYFYRVVFLSWKIFFVKKYKINFANYTNIFFYTTWKANKTVRYNQRLFVGKILQLLVQIKITYLPLFRDAFNPCSRFTFAFYIRKIKINY